MEVAIHIFSSLTFSLNAFLFSWVSQSLLHIVSYVQKELQQAFSSPSYCSWRANAFARDLYCVGIIHGLTSTFDTSQSCVPVNTWALA